MEDRVATEADGRLDEIVAAAGAHLEYLGDNRWFLSMFHADGTETAIWFGSKDLRRPMMEKRLPRP